MKQIKLSLSLLLVVYITIGSFAQIQNSQVNIDSLKRRVEEVEKKLSSREKELIDLSNRFNFVYRQAVAAEELAYKAERGLWVLGFNWFSGIFAIVGFLIGFLGIRKYMEIKTKERIEEHLKDPEWTQALLVKIKKQVAENKLKENVKILVISNDDDSEKDIKNYFQENKFNEKKISYKRGTEVVFNNTDFDILFINNQHNLFRLPEKSASLAPIKTTKKTTNSASGKETNSTNTETVSTVLDVVIKDIKVTYASRNYTVFYFNDGGVILPKELDKGLTSSYANSLASLYHNLLDLMRYKYVVLDNKKLD